LRSFGYNLTKWWIKAGLYLYYGKIKVSGLTNVPKDKPVLFLPNHQSALLDVLLIAVDCNRKPYFLTRSDVFKGEFLNALFAYFQMIPIYRIRDGRESLKNNQAIFDTCTDLLRKNEAILMFPEANHNLKRRVRPLSKGFTRILFNTLERAPETDIHIVPIGINYRNSLKYPDKVALYFGKPIPVKDSYDAMDSRASVDKIKAVVSTKLQGLTSHIFDEENYDYIVGHLDEAGVDYLDPTAVNDKIASLPQIETAVAVKKWSSTKVSFTNAFFMVLFVLLNLPIVLIWKIVVKPKVWEPEFMGTLRFGFALWVFPIYVMSLFGILAWIFSLSVASSLVLGLFLFNWGYARLR
jgi:1-acyl-sn-glycerol-3-phosphate acyltransferase